MQGDPKVDDLMRPVNAAIRRHVKNSDAITDIYNRAYEAIMISMDEKDSALRAENERLRKVLRMSRPYLLYADTAHEPPKELIAEIDEALKGGDE